MFWYVHAKLLQLYLTRCNPMDFSLPGSSVHGIFQTRILEWVVMPSSRVSSLPRDRARVSYVYLHWQVDSLPLVPPGKYLDILVLRCEYVLLQSFCGSSDSKESACNAGELGSIPGSGRSPEEGNSFPLQYSCLENPVDRGAWWATVHEVTKSRT